MQSHAELSRNPKGDTRVDYTVGSAKRMRLWEPIGVAVLETTFRHDGAILLQQYVDKEKIDGRIKETVAEAGAEGTKEVPYKEIAFDKACPWCGKHALVRFVQAYRSKAEIPVVPLYHCTDCRGRSYYLTDEYLIHLIANNPHLFEGQDYEKFKTQKDAFVAEMRGNIISIFASKKVKRIE
jgi:hypothetical protein